MKKMQRKIGIAFLMICIIFTSFAANSVESHALAKQAEDFVSLTDSAKKSQSHLAQYSEAERHAAELVLATWELLETKCDLTKFRIAYDDFWQLFYQLKDVNQRNFFIESVDVGYIWEAEENEFFVTTVEFQYKYPQETIREMLYQYDNAVARAVERVQPDWSELEKALYLNDYLAANTTYDISYSRYTAYDALVEKTAVCQGYSKAYQVLMNTIGIPCNIVASDSLNHAWNMIQIDGKSYYIDVTWNDPLGNCGGRSGHKYFLKSEQFMRSKEAEHFVLDDWENRDAYEMDGASSTVYDDCFWNEMDTCFFPIGDAWYAFDGNTSINKYQYKDGVFEKTATLVNIYDTWYAVGMPGYYWVEKYVGTAAYDGKLYYSTPHKIYQLDINTGISKVVFELSASKQINGNIWSIDITPEGELQYYWSADMEEAVAETALVLEKEENEETFFKNCYYLKFNGNGADEGFLEEILSCEAGQEYRLPANVYKNKNHTFLGWNTKPDGTGISYENEAVVKDVTLQNYQIVTLYAQWEKIQEITEEKKEDIEEDSQKDTEESVQNEKKTALSAEKVMVPKGQTVRISVLNNTQKVKWQILSGKKKITLKNKSKNGVTVKARKKGTAKVQAVIGTKKYTCTIKIV